jgi:hypothetical protein
MGHDQRPRSTVVRVLNAIVLTTAMAAIAYVLFVHQLTAKAGPGLPRPVATVHALADTRPLDVTVTRNWKKVHFQTSADELTASPSIWLDMHFGDWDRLPADVRRRGLTRLRHRFGSAVAGPGAWSVMTASEWDAVPQPIRMVAFPLMIEYWVGEYELGSAFHLASPLMTDTVSAIVMAESWFQHRSDVVNEWGNRDVGLGQCSNRCRKELARLAKMSLIGFSLLDDDYLNPWHATRAAVVWFGLELARAEGDVDLAIRAYHRGFDAASRGEGDEYLENVRRLRRKYFGPKPERSPTWQRLVLWAQSRAHERLEAPRVRAAIDDANREARPGPAAAKRQLAWSAAAEPKAEPHDTNGRSSVVRGRSR